MKLLITPHIRHIALKKIILPGILCAALAAAFFLLPFGGYFDMQRGSSVTDVINAKENGSDYIEATFPALYYTGYDFYRNDAAIASYYYAYDNENEALLFVLIKTEDTQESSAVLYDFTAAGKIRNYDKGFEAFLEAYSLSAGLSDEKINGAACDIYLDTLSYRPAMAGVVFSLLTAVFLICFICLLYNLAVLLFPCLHPSCLALKKYGLAGGDFALIDKEISEKKLFCAGNIYISDNYLVSLMKNNLLMIPMLNSVWAYGLASRQKKRKSAEPVYSMIIITSPKGELAINENGKAEIIGALAFLEKAFPHIVIGINDDIKQKMEKIIL